MSYHFHADPSHGWLAVKRAELQRLGIEHKVSHFSYQRGQTVYLEEDADAGLFIEAKKARGEPFDYRSSHTDRRSPIRSYAPFRPEAHA